MTLSALTSLYSNPPSPATLSGLAQTPLQPEQKKVSSILDSLGAAAVPQHLIPGHPPGSATYGQMLALSPNHPNRFRHARASELRELTESRRSFRPDGRPLALVIYPSHDTNEGFDDCEAIELMRGGHYQVVYVEARTDEEAFQAISRYGSIQPVSLLIVSGHGDAKGLDLGYHPTVELDNEPAAGRVGTYSLELEDIPRMYSLGLQSYMAEDSVVVLNACSGGKGGRYEHNMVNSLGQVFHASTVIGATDKYSKITFEYDDDGRVISAVFNQGQVETIRISPLTERNPMRMIDHDR